jgi:hypothetical protein
MKTIYPIDKEGIRIGPDEVVEDYVWENMQKFKNLRWRISEDQTARLRRLTKKELVELYELPEEYAKMKKEEIIDFINSL